MDYPTRPLPVCLFLLLALHLGTAAAGASGDAAAAGGISAGVVNGAEGVGTGAAAAGGAATADSLLPPKDAAYAVAVERGPAMSLNDLPLTSPEGTSANALTRGPLLAEGNAFVPLRKPRATRRALAHKMRPSRAEEERMAWSTPLPTNASCVPSGFCLPPKCLVPANGPSSYSFCGNTLGSSTTQASSPVCYQYCSSVGAALFQFNTCTFVCKCYKNIQSLSLTTKESYTIGYTQGLCPYCAPGQAYNPTWGALCQDCGDCLSRPSISSTCYTAYKESFRFSSAGTYEYWYNLAECPSGTPADETGTWSIPPGGSSFTCVSLATTLPSPASPTASIQFSSVDNCNSVLYFEPSSTCASGDYTYAFFKPPPSYTIPTRATC